MAKKINYSNPLTREALDEILNRAFTAADNLEQQTINKTNMTDEMRKTINNNIQTNTTDYPPTWKRLVKSFAAMMIVFMFVYAGFNVLIWLYDTLGMEHIMPTLIGIVLWTVVYDHMYGVPSKAPRV